MQTSNWSHGQLVDTPDTDLLNAALRLYITWFKALFGSQNCVLGSSPLVSMPVGSPIQVTTQIATIIINGEFFSTTAGTFNLSNGDATYHRYDLLTYLATTSTVGLSNGNPTTLDIASPVVVVGTPSASPVLPSLPANSIQVGWVDVGNGATTGAGCTLHIVPSFQAFSMVDFANHINALLTASIVHGVEATSAGGSETTRVAYTDSNGAVGRANSAGGIWPFGTPSGTPYPPTSVGGIGPSSVAITDTHGSVGQANTVRDTGGTARSAAMAGAVVANQLAVMDGNGSVGQAATVRDTGGTPRSVAPPGSTTSGVIPTLDSNGAVQYAEQLVVNGSPLVFKAGSIAPAVCNNQSYLSATVTFPTAFPTSILAVVIGITLNTGPISVQYGFEAATWSRSRTGFTYMIGQTTGSNQTIGMDWIAVGT